MLSRYFIHIISLFVASLISYFLIWRIHGTRGQGVYIQLNEVNYSNDSIVNVTDIGRGDNGSLLCITDNTNCCGRRMGEWYFPNNMSAVRTEGEGGSFYRNRGPSVVRLHRRHNASMPTGLFCCEIPDANEVIQRICITVEATIPFEATSVSTITPTINEQPLPTTSFDSSSTVATMTTTATATIKITTSTITTEISTTMTVTEVDTTTPPDVPATTTPDSSFTGVYFQLNGVNYDNNSEVNITDIGEGDDGSLLCITDNTNCCRRNMGEWYFPNNMSTVRTEGEGGSFYRSRGPSVVRLHRRHNVTMPTGLFCCEVSDASGVMQRICITITMITSGSEEMTQTDSIIITKVMRNVTTLRLITATTSMDATTPTTDRPILLQLRLFEIQTCLEWVNENANAKVEDISAAIISNINQRCQCGLSHENITNSVFRCFPSSPQAVTFRALLHGGAKVSSSELALYIKQWIIHDVTIPVQNVLINIDSSCQVVISSFDDRECRADSIQSINSNKTPAVVGGIVSCLLLFLVLAGFMIIALLWFRHRRQVSLKSSRDSKNQDQTIEMSATDSATHEYEVLDKYSKEYEDIHPVTPKQSTSISDDNSNYQLTKCPAYISTLQTKN